MRCPVWARAGIAVLILMCYTSHKQLSNEEKSWPGLCQQKLSTGRSDACGDNGVTVSQTNDGRTERCLKPGKEYGNGEEERRGGCEEEGAHRGREEITWYSAEDFFSEKKVPKPVGKGYITSMGAVVVDRKMFDEIVKGKEA